MDIEELKNKLVKLGWYPATLNLAIATKFKCEYCGCDLLCTPESFYSIEVEHIIPRDANGSGEEDNLTISCRTCNFIKRAWNPMLNDIENPGRAELIRRTKEYIKQKRDLLKVRISEHKKNATWIIQIIENGKIEYILDPIKPLIITEK